MALPFAAIGALAGGALNFLGGKSQSDATEEAFEKQQEMLLIAAHQLTSSFDDVIGQVEENPSLFAGSKVVGAPYKPISLAGSQKDAISANQGNLEQILGLVGETNKATIRNDLSRVNQLFPDYQNTLNSLSSSAASLSSGQLPGDVLQNIVGNRAGTSGAANTFGGGGPATLKDLGLSSLDAINQGQSMFQNILQAADQFVSPISRQTAAPQFFTSPQESTGLNLQQAQLQQGSEQNINNLNAQADPGANLLMQLQLARGSGQAGALAQIGGLGQPVVPSTAGLLGQSFAQPISNAISSFGQQNNGFNQGFGSFSNQGGFNPQQHNTNANYYNTFGPGSQAGVPPQAIVVGGGGKYDVNV